MNLPPLMTVKEVAEFFRINEDTVYKRPLRFGVKKIKGVGYRAPRVVVERIAGIPQVKEEE